MLKYNPDWTGGGMKRYTVSGTPQWAIDLFEATNFELFDVNVKFTRESWHGRIKACRGIGASSLSTEEISAFEKEHIEYLQSIPKEFDILHFVTILSLLKKKSVAM
ncbi:MAG: hypothetical protein LBD23_05005 [Oscillospiraceae bacterium]|nr:hypothetical protein [Oscillospiraceae bacterium]